jgi:hypothetical protein
VLLDPQDGSPVELNPDGRRYRLERLEKKPGGYAWVSESMIRYYPHGIYEVARQDDRFFYVKQYLPAATKSVLSDSLPARVALPVSTHFRWGSFDNGLPRRGQWRDNFAVADVNRDGFPDLIFTPARKTLGYPVIFLGNGRGDWSRWAEASFPQIAFDYGGAAAADFNADGHQDIAFGMHLLGVTGLTGNSRGEFRDYSTDLPRKTRADPQALSSRKIVAYDWDGDGLPDLVVQNERLGGDPTRSIRDGMVVYLNRTDKWVRSPSEQPLVTGALVAVDRSAKRLAVIDASAPAGKLKINERVSGGWIVHDVAGFADGAQFTALAITNTVDGKNPVYAVAYRAHSAAGWWSYVDIVSSQHGTWNRIPLHAAPGAQGTQVMEFAKLRPGDFNDLASLLVNGQIDVYRHVRESTYSKDQSIAVPDWRAGCQGYGMQVSDLDGDGIDELIAAYAGESTALSKQPECVSGGAIQIYKVSLQQ